MGFLACEYWQIDLKKSSICPDLITIFVNNNNLHNLQVDQTNIPYLWVILWYKSLSASPGVKIGLTRLTGVSLLDIGNGIHGSIRGIFSPCLWVTETIVTCDLMSGELSPWIKMFLVWITWKTKVNITLEITAILEFPLFPRVWHKN